VTMIFLGEDRKRVKKFKRGPNVPEQGVGVVKGNEQDVRGQKTSFG